MKSAGLLAVCASLSVAASHASESGAIVSYFEPLQRLNIENTVPATQQKVQATVPVTLTFDALGRTFELRLEPNTRFFSNAARGALTDAIAIYRGNIAGDADSWARIVVAGGMPRGLIWDGEQMYAVEAPGDSAVQTSLPVIYRLADAYVAPGTMTCGTSASSGNAGQMFDKLVGELGEVMAKAPGATSQINLGAIGDFEFFGDKSASSETAILTRLNNVDGIYSEQLGVQISVEELQVFTAANDPFTDSTNPGDLLDELAEYRSNTPQQRNQGLTHLYTGRDLGSTTVGIAFTDALCRQFFGAGLTQSGNDATFDSLVTAHEIGHNFGAPHDGEPGSACEAEPETFLMAPRVNRNDQFSQCSIDQMQPNIDAAVCIFPLPSVDMTIEFNGTLPTALLGNSVTMTFDVTNNGTEQATTVAADVSLPNNVSFVSVDASQGSCTSGAGTVNCQIGTVPGVSTRTVTLTTRAATTGTGNFVATVSADADDNPNNNDETVPLTVDPAVDLVVNAIAAAQVSLNQSTSISADLENRSVLNASSVELSISLNNGLRADSATWSLGACTVTAQQIDCESDNFGGQSGATLDIDLTGTAAGQSTYSVSLSSTEADANEANNSASGTVTISDPAAASTDSGGGGAAGLISLVLLGCAARRRRSRARSQRLPTRY